MNAREIKKINIPNLPGCYLFKDSADKIIYVGKAARLRPRVFSYWRKNVGHSPAKYSMMKEIKKIEFIETDSEIEALLLEANLIKKYRPRYNIVMRDDKRYVYIKVSTEEKWPRIFLTRKIEKSGRYFGPFTSTEAIKETLKIIRKIWPYRFCRTMPRRACLYYRIGKCPGMCENYADEKEYGRTIKQIVLFLDGRKSKVVANMESKLKKNKNEIEKRKIKYQLLNLKKVLDNANVLGLADKYAADAVELAKVLSLPRVPKRIEGYDISSIYGRQAVGSMVVFKDGEPEKNEYRKFKIKTEESAGDTGRLKEILERRFGHSEWSRPDLVIVDGGKQQLNVAVKLLKKYKLDIPVLAVSKGDGLRSSRAPDKIFFPGESAPLVLPLASPALNIIKRVRDEAHRFAIEYHRRLRRLF
ncbi:MAG: excinuclease ABC subunit UvrC [bacterium]